MFIQWPWILMGGRLPEKRFQGCCHFKAVGAGADALKHPQFGELNPAATPFQSCYFHLASWLLCFFALNRARAG
jgi:hypothetical protein